MSTIATERRVAARAVDVSKAYGTGDASVRALDAVTVGFNSGQFTAIMGPSGSGKSTLLHCLAGLDRPSSGEIHLGGVDITTLNDRQLTLLRRDKLGFIFQSFNLLPTLTDAVGLRPRLSHRPSELSGGQQQRVAAARALASRPEIVFADEPTGALDSQSSAELLGFLRHAVTEYGQTVVMVTHDPVAASYADRVVFLSDGHIVDEIDDPSADAVLDYMKRLGG
jgi:putative ABC transport system ATP-binding protein